MPAEQISGKEEAIQLIETELGISDEEKKDEVAELLTEEAENEEGNPRQLLQSIKDGAKNILANLGLETVSWVENPSQDSMFVMMKNNDNRVKKTTGIYKEPEENSWETVYGPVMRPNDIDKDGDVAPASHIRKAAHNFIAEGRVNQFDQDHDLNTGKGTLVESWILKEDKEYELPDGSTEVIEKGSWMIGVQPEPEVKERIEEGEITGWSIFGQADQIQLENNAKFKTSEESNSFKQSDTMSENQESDGENGVELKDVHSEIEELKSEFKEYAESPDPSTVKNVEELEKTLENLEKEEHAVVELSSDLELTSKEPEFENMTDLLDFLEDELMEENFSMIVDAVRGSEGSVEEEEDMDEEEGDEEKEAKEKGADEEKVRQEQVKSRNRESSGRLQPYKNRVKEA